MAMAPALYALPKGIPGDELADEISVEVVPDDQDALGDMVGQPGDIPKPEAKFGDNLLDTMDEQDARKLVSRLAKLFDDDKLARQDWEKAAAHGIQALGLKVENRTDPWEGACGIHSTVLLESVVRFGAQTIMEIFPSSGPVEIRPVGTLSEATEAAKRRVKQDLNLMLTRRMREYRSETERLLFHLPLTGSAFRKVYYDKRRKRPVSMFIPAEDVVIPVEPTHLDWCPRIFHINRMNKNDVDYNMATGLWKDVDIGSPAQNTNVTKPIAEKIDKAMGYAPEIMTATDYTIIEAMVDLIPDDFGESPDDKADERVACPYVVSWDYDSGTPLAVYRNWREEEPERNRRDHFVLYTYLPGFGVYGLGLVHLVGGITVGSTSILRQLVDAGTLSNLPGGLKARGLRIKGDDTPISPGEWRDADVPGGVLRDNIFPLPYKEPSQTLLTLLGILTEEGRRLGSVADLQVGDFQSSAPVGTTMALLERGMKIMSSVQARIHASMTIEFGLISDIVREWMPGPYEYPVEGGESAEITRAADYGQSISIEPVSDPNASSLAMRITQHQATLQLASQKPDIYDQPYLHRSMLDVIGMQNPNRIIPPKPELKPTDPVTENQSILLGKPVKAFITQDHDSHMAVHMAAMQDPQIQAMVGQSPQAAVISGAMMAHIGEHLAFAYRKRIEMALGAPLPPPEQELPPDVENQIALLEAQAAKVVLEQSKSKAAQQAAEAAAQDPVLQAQNRELDIKAADVERQGKADAMRTLVDIARVMQTGDNNVMMAEGRAAAADVRTDTSIMSARIKSDSNEDVAKIKAAAELLKTIMTITAQPDEPKAEKKDAS